MMNAFFRNKSVLFAVIVIGISVVYQCLAATHGFDLTDEGYLMCLYRFFPDYPELSGGTEGYPLTCLLGHLFLSIYPQGGILWMRMVGILFVTLTEISAFLLLRKHFNPYICISSILVIVMQVAGDPKPFGYNTMTTLFAVLSISLLLKGLKSDNKLWIVFGGLLTGMNVYIRIPNLTLIALSVIPFFFIEEHRTVAKAFKEALLFFAGILVGITALWPVMKLTGADELILSFFSSVTDLMNGESSHNSNSMLLLYSKNYWKALVIGVTFVLIFLLMCPGVKFAKKGGWLLVLGGAAAIYQYLYIRNAGLGPNSNSLFNGLGLIGALIYFKSESDVRGIALAAFLLSLLIPLGSDQGFLTMWTGCYLAFPVGMCALFKVGERIYHNPPRTAFALFITVIIISQGVRTFKRCYYDPGSIFLKTEKIQSPYAAGIRTVEKRAVVINTLLDKLSGIIHNGDVVFFYDFSPMMYYLTETRPYAGVVWPCIYYGDRYARIFEQATKESSKKPVIILQHFVCSNNWGTPDIHYFNTEKNSYHSTAEMNKVVMDFIIKNHYQPVWSNRYYEILTPPATPD